MGDIRPFVCYDFCEVMTVKQNRRRLLICVVMLFAALLCSPRVCAADLDAARQAIVAGACEEAETISLEQFQISCNELEQLYEQMRIHNDLPWYVNHYSYNYNMDSRLVNFVTLKYLDPAQYDRALYEQRLSQVFCEAVLPGMSDWQIALSLHDYLAVHASYDESLKNHEAYDLLVKGTAVCEGYAQAYQDLLDLAGIDNILCTSISMDHEWNMVRIGQSWYHVDVTWDDPVSDRLGRVNHNYFLLDDSTISDQDHEHYGWTKVYSANDPSLVSNGFWFGITSQICYESAQTSYIRMDDGTEHRILRRDETTGRTTELAFFDAGGVDIGDGLYHYYQYGLALWNGRLYYSDMEYIYSMNIGGGDQAVEFGHDAGCTGKYISGFRIENNTLNMMFADRKGQHTTLDTPLAPQKAPSESDDSRHTHIYRTDPIYTDCESPGYLLHVCDCGDSYRGEVLDAVEHVFDDGQSSGKDQITYTCLVCGHTYDQTLPVYHPSDQNSQNPLRFRWHIPLFLLLAIVVNQFEIKRNKKRRKHRSRDDDWSSFSTW